MFCPKFNFLNNSLGLHFVTSSKIKKQHLLKNYVCIFYVFVLNFFLDNSRRSEATQ